MSQVGRISGPLLTANLERNGINLAFRNNLSTTQLLYLDVNSGKIGINKSTSGYELEVNGTARSTNLISTTNSIANYTIENNNLNVLVGDIYLNAAEAIKLSNFETDNIHISDNAISSYRSNANIDLKPFGAGLPPNDGVVTSTFGGGEAGVQKDLFGEGLLLTAEPSSATWIAIQTLEPGDAGIITISSVDYPFTLTSWSSIDREEAVIDIPTLANGSASFDLTITIRPITYKTTEIINDLEVIGNLNATGNITADGNIIIGDSDTDSVILNADIANDIIPAANDTYAIGSPTKRWDSLYTFLLNGQGISVSSLIAQGGGDFSLRQGNIFFVSVNGSDTASGDNVQAPFLTVKRALEAADASTAGPVSIQIFAGEYQEEFPLTVPSNVTVQGVDMRNTIIKPTVATQYNDAFLLNGESTVQNLTIKDFYNSPTVEITLSNVIDNPSAVGGDRFGQAVAVDGDYAIVGAYQEDDAGGLSSGKAYIFNVTTGTLVHTLDNPNAYSTSLNDNFGNSVAISGNYAIVGTNIEDDAGGGQSGKAYIFNVTTGALLHTLDNPNAYGTSLNDYFGLSVAISGNYAIVGASLEDEFGGGGSGKAYIFNAATGVLVHTLNNPNAYDTSTNDRFGVSVAISGNYAIVGAYGEDDAGGGSSGKAYIFDVATGALLHTLDNPNAYGTSVDDRFGEAVAIDGDYAIVGVATEDDAGGTYSGKAYIFNVATGALLYTLDNPNAYDTSLNDFFGYSVAISGNYAIVGAYFEDDGGTGLGTQGGTGLSSGKAYIFNVVTGDLLQTLDNPNAYGTSATDYFAQSVAISGNYAIVGAQLEDVLGSSSNGKAYTYNLSITEEDRYAFRFAPNTVVSTRSPYVQNVSVITKGSITSADDPRGFNAGNAGGGAYIDGANVNSVSNEASMLFHSCTFITPGVDAVTMTNGVRVEWLNSFTYFANRGLYAVDGVTGHLSTDGSTVKYGAEIRSIGSANVYGNYGAVADGVDTLMYLIQHNFGYVGAGKYVDNDASRAIQTNEVVKLNSGKIYYQSVNHFGDFRVGDQFFIDQESGNTSIVLTEAEVDSLNGLVITTNGQTTFIDGEKIDIGDFTIAGNLLKTNTQSFNVASANNINFTSNVAISKNLTMTGDITIGGTLITLGNQSTDTINFNTPFSQDIEPDISGLYNLGSIDKKWIKSWLGEANFSDVQFNENYITTTISNADLELRANGTGRIYLPDNDLEIGNNLTVNSNTFLNGGSYISSNINLTLTLDNPNAYGTSASDRFGFSLAISGDYAIVGAYQEDDAGVNSGKAYIFNVATGALLHTLDNPNAYSASANDQFGRSVAISGNYAIVGAHIEGDFGGFNSGKAYIFNVTTGALLHTLDNPNPFGTSDNDYFGFSLAISGNYAIVGAVFEDDAGYAIGTESGKAYIFNVTTGALVHTLDNPNAYSTSASDYFGWSVSIDGNYAIVGAYGEDDAGGSLSGKAYIFNVTTGALLYTLDNPNAYSTSSSDRFGYSVGISSNYAIVGAYLEDDSGGISSGKAYIYNVTTGVLLYTLDNPNAYSTSGGDQFGVSVAISGNYAIVGANAEDDSGGLSSGKAYIYNVTTGVLLYTLDNPNAFDTSFEDNFGWSVAISGNYAIVGARYEDDAGGSDSGKAYIFQFTDPTLIVNPTDVNITGTVIQTGDTTISNDLNVTGAAHITGLLDVSAKAQLENILIDGNLITTTVSNSDLDLRASGTGNINIPNNDVVVSNAFTVRDIIGTDLVVQTSVALNEIITSSQIVIDDNFITTSLSNSNLELRANGTGGLQIQDDMLFNQNVISTTQDLNFTIGGNLNITSDSALLLSNGDDSQRVNNAAGNIRFSTQDNVFEGYGIAPIGFGGVYSADRRTNIFAHPANDTINITVNNLAVGQVNSGGIEIHGLQTDNVNINANVISTSVSNSDLELVRNGLGRIVVGDTIFKNNQIINNNPSSGLILANTANGYVKFAGGGAVVFPSGNNTTERGTANQIGDARWNETDGYMEVWDGTSWITAQGGGETVTSTFMQELIGEWSLILG